METITPPACNAAASDVPEALVYPDSDGLPMSDNTQQWDWITRIKDNLEILFRDNPEVFVAGNLLWYPVEGSPKIRMAPDVLVALGRPKGYRGSYRQWNEGGIPPQVVFEIQSPGNRHGDTVEKALFYNSYGVEEFYLYDPDTHELMGMVRQEASLQSIPEMDGWVSPRLGIRFSLEDEGLRIYGPDGKLFENDVERARAAERESARAEAEAARAEKLAAQLRALGIEPDA